MKNTKIMPTPPQLPELENKFCGKAGKIFSVDFSEIFCVDFSWAQFVEDRTPHF